MNTNIEGEVNIMKISSKTYVKTVLNRLLQQPEYKLVDKDQISIRNILNNLNKYSKNSSTSEITKWLDNELLKRGYIYYNNVYIRTEDKDNLKENVIRISFKRNSIGDYDIIKESTILPRNIVKNVPYIKGTGNSMQAEIYTDKQTEVYKSIHLRDYLISNIMKRNVKVKDDILQLKKLI